MKPQRKRDVRIPRRPLLWLAAALLFTLPPMFVALASWVPFLFLIALAAKFWMEPKGRRLRSAPAKLILAAGVLSGIFFCYGMVKGIEPGVSLIVLLMSIKILEAHTAREFQVMVMIAFVLCLCGFFLSQDLAIAVSLLIAFALLLIALVEFHRGSPWIFWAPVRVVIKLLAQATPLIVLLFLFFPRISTGLRMQIAQPRGATGFSGQLSPGSVTSLANSSEVAFRAEFPDGELPEPNAMYWRGIVMWRCNGLEWRAPEAPAARPRTSRPETIGAGIRQFITLEPNEGHWMFALDSPTASPPGSILAAGNYLWSGQPIHRQRRYEVTSFAAIREKELQERERKLSLQVSASISDRTWSLVQSWSAKTSDRHAIVREALQFFRTQDFRYSLSPGEYSKADLDQFLFVRRTGFCEHYAASFATLMRLSGIPARVVTGYLGGEYNQLGHFFIVRQSDAHAWCEVWFPQTGWERVDPTAVVAPDRVNLGLSSFLERSAGGRTQSQNGFAGKLARWPMVARARLAWQTLNYSWDTRVLSFDSDAQESFFEGLGWGEHGWLFSVVGLLIGGIVLLAFYAGWARLRTRTPSDEIRALYGTFCRKAARLGAERQPSEGPRDFYRRAIGLLPNESQRMGTIFDAYIALRYAGPQDRHSDGLVPRRDRHLRNTLAKEIVLFGRKA